MKTHPKRLDLDFPEQTYRMQRKRFIEILRNRLGILDEETKWDDYFFTPLDAEVEINASQSSRKKIVDLMKALRTEKKARLMLLLGDPGAGKSIALRKLAKDLLKEVEATDRVPVYVNLKEWITLRSWDEQNPPTAAELRDFVLSTLKGQNIFADQFLSDYFDRMFDHGRFFFLLDSFDEIPSVLDVAEASILIERLSLILTEFFTSQDAGRGIISSRFYRRPRLHKENLTVLEIRPFSDLRVHQALKQSSRMRDETLERLFTVRTELIPIARNPFAAALLRIYAETHAGDLPDSQLDMYESYVNSRLLASKNKLAELSLDWSTVLAGAIDIAWAMFDAVDIGLEASVAELEKLLPGYPIQSITSVLRYSGLARLSTSSNPRFSFVHRRINEYFVACRLVMNPRAISLQSIPTDSRYRDALALYCEVGKLEDVREIADFCWAEIQRINALDRTSTTEERLRAVHCLRFLRDAFGGRVAALSFRKELSQYVFKKD
jgi:predicted NACHT family NTPase